MKSIASSHRQSRHKQHLFAALWLLVGLLAVYGTAMETGYLQRHAIGQEVEPFHGALAETSILKAIEGAGLGKQIRNASTSQTLSAAISTSAQGSYAVHPQSGNPAEESEVKSGKDCPGSRCYAARLGLPDARQAGQRGREPGDDAQALPLYDMFCSWRAYLAQA
jgi:hypothetical protein